MAVLSSFHAFVPRMASQRAAAAAARVAAVAGEIVLFLWMAVALAFSLVVMAGFLL